MRLSRDCMVYCGIAILLCFTQGAISNDTQLYSKPQQSVDYDEAAGQDPVPGASRMGHWAHWGNTTEEATQMNQGVAPLISVQRMRFATHTSPLSEPARLPSMHDELMSEMLLKSLDFLESSNQENDDSLPPTSIEHQRHIILLPQHDAMATYNEHPVSPIPNGILIRMRFRSMGVGDENELPAQQVSPEPIEDASANQPEAVDPYVPSYSNSEDETSNEPHVPFTPHRSQWSALRKRSLFLCGFCIACIILSLLCTVALLQTILSRIASVRRVAAESSMIPPASLNEVVTPKTKVK